MSNNPSKDHDSPIFNLADPVQFARLSRYLNTLPPALYRIEITRVREQRSLKQNAYYFGVVLPHAAKGVRDAWGTQRDQDGNEINSMWAHRFFKGRFLTQLVCSPDGELLSTIVRSTTDLDTAQFAEYLNEIIAFCGEWLGTEIPEATRFIEPPPRTLDDGPEDPEELDRQAERAAGTPREFGR